MFPNIPNISDIRGTDIRKFNQPKAARPAISSASDASPEDLAAIQALQEREARAAAAQAEVAENLAAIQALQEREARAAAAQAEVAETLAAIQAIHEMEHRHAIQKQSMSRIIAPAASHEDFIAILPQQLHIRPIPSASPLGRVWAIPASSQMVAAAAPHTSTKMQNTHLRLPESARVSSDSEEKIRELQLLHLANHQSHQPKPHQQLRLMQIKVGEASIAYTKAQSRHTELRQELREKERKVNAAAQEENHKLRRELREKEREVNAAAQEENHKLQLLNKIRGL